MLSILFILYHLLLVLPLTYSKTLIGLVDRLSSNQVKDYVKLGEFCYTIPEDKRGSIDSEVVSETASALHTVTHLLLLKKTEQNDLTERFIIMVSPPEKLLTYRFLNRLFLRMGIA